MIKANELRIGNKLLLDGRIVTVNKIDDCREEYHNDFLIGNYEDLASYPSKEYEPIPLTPKMLVDWCGFKYGKVNGISSFEEEGSNDKEITYYWDFRIKQTEFVESHNISLVKWGEQEYFTFQLERGFYRQKIKHLHQLQNLYRYLSGEEMTVNQLPELTH